jgi:hypothetical protein
MGAGLGAILGMVTGGALGFAGSKFREGEQQKQQLKMLQLKDLHDTIDPSQKGYDPSTIDNPEWVKYVVKSFGNKDASDAFLMQGKITAAGVKRKQQQDMAAVAPILQMISGGQMPQMGGPQGSAGTAPGAQPSPGQGQPAPGAQAPQGQPGASPTSAAPATAQPSPQSQAAPAAAPNDYESQLQKLDAAKAAIPFMKLAPELETSLTSSINDRVKHIERLQDAAGKQADFDETRHDRLLAHADTEADRSAQRDMMKQVHEETTSMQEGNRIFMQEMAKERNQDQREAHFQTESNSLAVQTKNIATMLTAANPAPPATVKTLLNARNAQARTLKQAADKYGIEYDPDQFKPMTTQQIKSGGLMGTGLGASTTTSLTEDTSGGATAPVASKSGRKMVKDPKSKTGWSYAE